MQRGSSPRTAVTGNPVPRVPAGRRFKEAICLLLAIDRTEARACLGAFPDDSDHFTELNRTRPLPLTNGHIRTTPFDVRGKPPAIRGSSGRV